MASGRLALRMPPDRPLPLGLWQGLFFSCLICHVGTSKVPKLNCQTDFATEVVCRWDVDKATNCTQEFRLHYSVFSTYLHRKSECVIENGRIPGSASPSCICIIPEIEFGGINYTFSLGSRRRLFKDSTMTTYLDAVVKPRPLRNLTVTKSSNSFVLKWTKDYTPGHVLSTAQTLYQVVIVPEGKEEDADPKNVTEATDCYEIFAGSLLPRIKYTARVRYLFVSWGTPWSDWSNTCVWESGGGDELVWLIPVCLVVMVVISACYISLARLKRRWWDQVPSPAKSKLAKELGEKPWLIMWKTFPGDGGRMPARGPSQTPLERLEEGFGDSPPGQWGASPGQSEEVAKSVPGSSSRPRGPWGAFLTPEVPSVEPALVVGGHSAEPGPEAPVDPEQGHTPHEDALADLFLDILGGGGDHTPDAETPEPVLEQHPPARAAEEGLSDHGLRGGTTSKGPGRSSKSGYWTSSGVASAQAAGPAPELHLGPVPAPPYKSLDFPQLLPSLPYQAVVADRILPPADGRGSSRAATPQPSPPYRSFSGLLGLNPPSAHQPWTPQLGLSPATAGQAQAQGGRGPSAATAPDPLPTYRPLRAVLPFPVAPLDSGCPYKPLLGVFGSLSEGAPPEPVLGLPGAGRGAWPWEKPPASSTLSPGMEEGEDSAQGGVQKGTEGLVPHLPVATLRL